MSKFFLVLVLSSRMTVVPDPYPTLEACNLGGRMTVERWYQSPQRLGSPMSFVCVEVQE